VSDRFEVVSTGWYEMRRLPLTWWPRYLVKRCRKAPHWRVANTMLLSHPGCLLSRYRSYQTALSDIQELLRRQRLLVVVTHWWEYFPAGAPDADFIDVLHSVAEWLAQARDVRVLRFSDVATGTIRLN
jgi:hypothetical protein